LDGEKIKLKEISTQGAQRIDKQETKERLKELQEELCELQKPFVMQNHSMQYW